MEKLYGIIGWNNWVKKCKMHFYEQHFFWRKNTKKKLGQKHFEPKKRVKFK